MFQENYLKSTIRSNIPMRIRDGKIQIIYFSMLIELGGFILLVYNILCIVIDKI